MCKVVEFLGGVFEEGATKSFIVNSQSFTYTHCQIVDLEDIVYVFWIVKVLLSTDIKLICQVRRLANRRRLVRPLSLGLHRRNQASFAR